MRDILVGLSDESSSDKLDNEIERHFFSLSREKKCRFETYKQATKSGSKFKIGSHCYSDFQPNGALFILMLN